MHRKKLQQITIGLPTTNNEQQKNCRIVQYSPGADPGTCDRGPVLPLPFFFPSLFPVHPVRFPLRIRPP